jgi:hypothetical protein
MVVDNSFCKVALQTCLKLGVYYSMLPRKICSKCPILPSIIIVKNIVGPTHSRFNLLKSPIINMKAKRIPINPSKNVRIVGILRSKTSFKPLSPSALYLKIILRQEIDQPTNISHKNQPIISIPLTSFS